MKKYTEYELQLQGWSFEDDCAFIRKSLTENDFTKDSLEQIASLIEELKSLAGFITEEWELIEFIKLIDEIRIKEIINPQTLKNVLERAKKSCEAEAQIPSKYADEMYRGLKASLLKEIKSKVDAKEEITSADIIMYGIIDIVDKLFARFPHLPEIIEQIPACLGQTGKYNISRTMHK